MSGLWSRTLATFRRSTNTNPLLSSRVGRPPTHRKPKDSSLQRSLSLGPRPSVEPPHVFDYQFARSPSASAAPSVASYQQRPYRPTEGNEDDLQPIEEEETPPRTPQRTSFDDEYLATEIEREVAFADDGIEPPVPNPNSFSASALEDALRASNQPQKGKPEPADNDATKVSRSSAVAIGDLIPPVSTLPMRSPSIDGRAPSTFDGLDAPTTAPSVKNKPVSERNRPVYYNTTRATCSLNLVCYRSGAKGCDLQQIQCILRSNFPTDESFQKARRANKYLVHTDDEFFREMQRLYKYKMCGFFRRYFSLKTLRAFRVLAYTPTTRPTVVPFDDFVLQEMMYAYRNPDRLFHASDDWIKWVFRLRRKEKRHALEFVEGWNTTRIAISGTVPWLASCLFGVIWTARGGDPQTAFTVASFILTSSSIILALLAIISSIESSG
ncbi:hypothetical protein QBC34DRAFT_290524 [Podospora aff. communis PSN243]|uniref:Uncharacterized protein n=1 Tax=Podospora aff. communis PSN243 TaxID=3040156 RepID=A0AAV9H0H1_9PEZI|nr:hypothetical protein QBC34DRAFT_290524 [Podospora aff. communis PSN243]